MMVMAQMAMVMNLDKCIGCHTCSVTCKQARTNRPGKEYVWFNDVERDADPVAAYDVLRRGLAIAKESDNRFTESHFAVGLSRLAATHGDPLDAFEFLTVAIRNFYDSGSFSIMAGPFAILAASSTGSDTMNPPPPSAGSPRAPSHGPPSPRSTARSPTSAKFSATRRLRILISGAGANMTNAAMATYAFDQIDQARAELNAVSK